MPGGAAVSNMNLILYFYKLVLKFTEGLGIYKSIPFGIVLNVT